MAQDFLQRCTPYLEAHQTPKGAEILQRRAIVLSFLDSDFKFQRGQTDECVAEIRRKMKVDVSTGTVRNDAMCYRKARQYLSIRDREGRAGFLEKMKAHQNPDYRIVQILHNAGIQTWEDLEPTPAPRGRRAEMRQPSNPQPQEAAPATTPHPPQPATVADRPSEDAVPPLVIGDITLPNTLSVDPQEVRISKAELDALHTNVAELLRRYQEQSEAFRATLSDLQKLQSEHTRLTRQLADHEKAEALVTGLPYERLTDEYRAFTELGQTLEDAKADRPKPDLPPEPPRS